MWNFRCTSAILGLVVGSVATGGWEVAIPNRLTAVQEGIRVMSDGDLPTATIRV